MHRGCLALHLLQEQGKGISGLSPLKEHTHSLLLAVTWSGPLKKHTHSLLLAVTWSGPLKEHTHSLQCVRC